MYYIKDYNFEAKVVYFFSVSTPSECVPFYCYPVDTVYLFTIRWGRRTMDVTVKRYTTS